MRDQLQDSRLEPLVNGKVIYRAGRRGSFGGGEWGVGGSALASLSWNCLCSVPTSLIPSKLSLSFGPKSISPKDSVLAASSHLSQDPKFPTSLLRVESYQPEISMLKS